MLDFLPKILFMKKCRNENQVDEESVTQEKTTTTVDQFRIIKFVEEFLLHRKSKIDPKKSSELGKIHAELKYIADHIRDGDKEGDYENEWKYAAVVCDR